MLKSVTNLIQNKEDGIASTNFWRCYAV